MAMSDVLIAIAAFSVLWGVVSCWANTESIMSQGRDQESSDLA